LKQTLTLVNSGAATVEGTTALVGIGFEIVSGDGPYVLQPDQSMSIEVRFIPPDTGSYAGVLVTGSECGEVGVSGNAVLPVAGAQCNVLPDSVNFDDVVLASSSEKSFKITNSGAADFSGNVVSLCNDFAVVVGGGSYTLSPGDTHTVTVRFTPVELGPSVCLVTTGVNCADVVMLGTGGSSGQTVSFANDIQPIFNASCAVSGCHVQPAPKAGLVLAAGGSYANLVGVTSQNYSPAQRIVSGDPSTSVLYNKISNTGQFGGKMPPSGIGLSAQQIELIRLWILEGAADN